MLTLTQSLAHEQSLEDSDNTTCIHCGLTRSFWQKDDICRGRAYKGPDTSVKITLDCGGPDPRILTHFSVWLDPNKAIGELDKKIIRDVVAYECEKYNLEPKHFEPGYGAIYVKMTVPTLLAFAKEKEEK